MKETDWNRLLLLWKVEMAEEAASRAPPVTAGAVGAADVA